MLQFVRRIRPVPIAGDADKVEGRVQLYFPRQIAQENRRPLEHAHKDNGLSGKIARDLRAQLLDPLRNLLAREKNFQVRHGTHM